MAKNYPCVRCGSNEMLVPGVSLADSGWGEGSSNHHELIYDAKPNALIFKERLRVGVSATVCCTCGFVMFSIPVTGPDDFYGSGTGSIWNAHMDNQPG